MEELLYILPAKNYQVVFKVGIQGLISAEIGPSTILSPQLKDRGNGIVEECIRWLNIYFSGREPNFLPIMEIRGTTFQRKVWNEVASVPYGKSITYGELAFRVNSHPRAVARALACNPIHIFIPCHRIVSAKGLGGYAAGVRIKEHLLALERGDKCSKLSVSF